MVNTGPSKGCNTCRQRRVKCDQRKPACFNCTRLAIDCTGYDKKKRAIKFKDQNANNSTRRSLSRVVSHQCRAGHEGMTGVEESTSCLRPLAQPMVLYAICFFFNNFVTLGRNLESTRGFIENILPIYTRARQTSPIALAVSAVSISVFSKWRKDRETSDTAAEYLNAALSGLQKSLNDPCESECDENLMTTIILQLHETLHAVTETRAAIPVHQNGAISLVRSRGIQNFRVDTAKYLVLYIRSAEVCCAIREGRYVNEELAGLGRRDNMPSNPTLELDKLGVLVANAQAHFIELGQCSPCERQLRSWLHRTANLYQKSLNLERELLHWSQALPEHWLPLKVNLTNQIPMYSNTCEIYPTIHIASIWNTWRCYRLIVSKIILEYGHMQNSFPNSESGRRLVNTDTSELSGQVQAIVDSICYSVPFHLGNRFGECTIVDMFDTRLEFPAYHALNRGEMSTQGMFRNHTFMPRNEHIRHAIAQGPWHIASQLSQLVILLSGESGRLLTSALRPGQLAWIHGQLLRASALLGLSREQICISEVAPLDMYSVSFHEMSTQAGFLASSLRKAFRFTGI